MRRASPTAPVNRQHLPATTRYLGLHAPDEPLDVTLVLRRRQPLKLPMPPLQHAEFAARHGADPADVERLRAFGLQHGMQELACDLACRTLHWRCNVKSLQQVFGVRLGRYQMAPGGPTFVGCEQAPTLPDPAVIAVLGLDRRPVAHPHFRIAQAQPSVAYTPL